MDALARFFQEIFPSGVHLGYCAAGQSYLEGGWYEAALEAFQKALEVNPKSRKARHGLNETRRMLKL
ncbi:MAG: tetratricopeptide repeat protein, partial [Pseudomonadota bacterium]